ncbi:MAG: serine/threonine protein kinase [Acidobacteriia bacterium]|nr:serine/threonine protein kinase [Terriglobia bacterium]
MSSPTGSSVREAFSAALECVGVQREAVLAQLPPETRAEVESLLEAHASAGSFLEAWGEGPIPLDSRIGPYRLLEKLGHGGMGVVYHAQRDDGEFTRDAAIKFVGGPLFGSEAERRFIAERQILALLDHPNIVHLIDGGVWRGHRYLVMELVVGRPLTEFCAQRELSTPERLRLLQTICSAIHYAHQRLIIHRDLKPGNILVTGDGQVKVLDFGIARMLDAEEPAGGNTTTAWHPMSLSCASPEQTRGERVTLATDIYSLGLLLYELLTGVNPQSAGAQAEILRRIADEQPLPPSKVAAGVPADLDAIALKALAKDPVRRYASAEEMSADIQRFLENRPVLARAPSRLYYAARFCARNKALTCTGLALLVAILAGITVSTWQARRAEKEAAVAQRRFNEARRLIYIVIHEIQPKLESINGTVAVQAALIEQTLTYLEALEKDAAGNPALLRELIDAYLRLASVTGSGSKPSVGNPQKAGELLRRAETLLDQLRRADPSSPDSLRTEVEVYRSLARSQFQYGSGSMSEASGRRALRAAERLAAATPGDSASQDVLALAAAALGDTLFDAQQRIPLYERSMSIWNHALEANPPNAETLRRNVALMCKDLSTVWLSRDGRRALDYAAKAREIDEVRLASKPSSPAAQLDLGFDLGAEAAAYNAMKDYSHALGSQRRNVELRLEIVRANPADFRASDRLGFALHFLGEIEENQPDDLAAQRDYRRAINVYGRLQRTGAMPTTSLRQYAKTRLSLARLERKHGQTTEACRELRNMLEVLDEYEARVRLDVSILREVEAMRQEALDCTVP